MTTRIEVRQLPNKSKVIYAEQGDVVHMVTLSHVNFSEGGSYSHELKVKKWEDLDKVGEVITGDNSKKDGVSSPKQAVEEMLKLSSDNYEIPTLIPDDKTFSGERIPNPPLPPHLEALKPKKEKEFLDLFLGDITKSLGTGTPPRYEREVARTLLDFSEVLAYKGRAYRNKIIDREEKEIMTAIRHKLDRITRWVEEDDNLESVRLDDLLDLSGYVVLLLTKRRLSSNSEYQDILTHAKRD